MISNDEKMFFSLGYAIDYLVLKEGIGYIYDVLDYIYHIVDQYLSS